MDCMRSDMSVGLAAAEYVTLDNARGTPLRVTRGTVWITQERSYDDIVLSAGDTWTVDRQGLTVIQAHEDAVLCMPQRAHRVRRIAAPAPGPWNTRARTFLRKVFRGWTSLHPDHPVPYF